MLSFNFYEYHAANEHIEPSDYPAQDASVVTSSTAYGPRSDFFHV